MLSDYVCAEQQTISTSGCIGIDVTCGCCKQPDLSYKKNRTRTGAFTIENIKTRRLQESKQKETEVSMGMVVLDINTNVTATEEDVNNADEVNKIGGILQVLPPLYT
jgi:hypothetical protein